MGEQNPAPARSRDIDALSVLRIFAALLVVFSHQYIYWPWTGSFYTSFVLPLVTRGDVGVKIFFILSGFILTHAYGSHEVIDRREFFLARFARIYPMYLVGLVMALPILVLFQVPEHIALHGSVSGIGITALKCLSVLLLLQSWIPPAYGHWNGVAWSLSTEAFFYALFPWVMPLFRNQGPRILWTILAIGVVLETIRTAAIHALADHQTIVFLTFFPALRLSDFLTGIAIGILYRQGRRIRPVWSVASIGLLAGGALLVQQSDIGFAMIHIGSAILVASLASSEWEARSFLSRTAVILGYASYGAYLIHQPLGYVLSAGLERFTHTRIPYMVSFGILLAVSVLLYHFVETPSRNWIRTRFSKRKR